MRYVVRQEAAEPDSYLASWLIAFSSKTSESSQRTLAGFFRKTIGECFLPCEICFNFVGIRMTRSSGVSDFYG